MKKIFNKSLIIALAGVALVATSCKEDYLDTAPTDKVESGTALGTAKNAIYALNGIAKTMTTQQAAQSQGFAGENNIMAHYENYASQDYLYNYYASGWSPIMNQKYHFQVSSRYNYYAWYYYYTIIGQANAIIVNIDNIEGKQEERDYVKASALTFRAYAYEKLLHYYCVRWQDSNNGAAQGLVLRLDESTGDMPYSTMAEVYAQIYKDLDDAIALYNSCCISRAANEVWMPCKNVADAVYARAALTKQDYQTALTHATAAKAGFPLMSNNDYANSGFCAPTSEWIFGSYGSAEENNWYWSYGTQYSCNGYYAEASACGAGAISREVINRIPNNDFRKSLFLTEDKFTNFSLAEQSPYFKTYAILGIDGKGKEDALWDEVADYISAHTPKAFESMPAYSAGYFYLGGHLKFWVTDLPGIGYLPYIRTSEMILIEAEANYFLKKEDAAQKALVELNATSGRNPNYTCSKTGNDLFEEIVDYRTVELWGEGFGFSDFKRWNRTIVRKSIAQGGNAHAAIAVTIKPEDGNAWTWKVPEIETNYNKALGNDHAEKAE